MFLDKSKEMEIPHLTSQKDENEKLSLSIHPHAGSLKTKSGKK